MNKFNQITRAVSQGESIGFDFNGISAPEPTDLQCICAKDDYPRIGWHLQEFIKRALYDDTNKISFVVDGDDVKIFYK